MRTLLLGCCVAVLCFPALANDAPTPAAPVLSVPLATALVPASLAAAPATATPSNRAGTLRAIKGTVQVGDAGGSLRAARPGDAVERSELVVTSADSAASIVLRDGTALVLGPSSRLELRDFQFDSTTQQGDMWMSLLHGSLRMITGLIGTRQPSAVRLQARTVTVGIRGTDFIVQLEEQ